MGKIQDTERLVQAVKDAEARLRVFKNTLDTINREIDHLNFQQGIIQENIAVLKMKNVVALAAEYKKSKEELAKTKTKLIKYKLERLNIGKASKDTEEYMRKAKEDLAATQKESNNVLQFGRNNNGQS